jgi:hypothetical protein
MTGLVADMFSMPIVSFSCLEIVWKVAEILNLSFVYLSNSRV